MNKTINKLLAGVLALGLICSGTAFAKDPVEVSKDGEKVTVTVTTLGSGEETTLLVVPQDVTISQAFADTTKIYHMDQVPASTAGVATFNFKYSGDGNLDIYSGYATMSATDVPYEGVLDLSGGTGGGAGDFIYGDVNNDGDIDILDASAIINFYLSGTPFYEDVSSKTVYKYGEQAANVYPDNDIDILDASAVIGYYLQGTDFPVNNQ